MNLAIKEKTTSLNRLLESEAAAIKTYDFLLERLGPVSYFDALNRIRDDHINAAVMLRQFLSRRGGDSYVEGRCWDSVTEEFKPGIEQGTPRLLAILRNHEEQNLRFYEEASKDPALDAECLSLIKSNLLPLQREHIDFLDSLEK